MKATKTIGEMEEHLKLKGTKKFSKFSLHNIYGQKHISHTMIFSLNYDKKREVI